ncbi:putative membrane protein [Lachnospiraceae bacterium KM106-2]|nr:putative membrane protein [Lachnospiraceae bacterium KM106-2]
MKDSKSNYYLVGPDYYKSYCNVLKIVLICIGISGIISAVFSYDYASFGVIDFIIEIIMSVMVSLVTGVGLVTIIFAILEYKQVEVNIREEKTVSKPVMDRALIKRSDTIIGMVFILIFGSMLAFTPKLFGVYLFENHKLIHTISVFNIEHWQMIRPLIVIAFLLCFLDEVIKLMTGCYNILVLISNVVTNVVFLVLMTIVLKWRSIWNPDFAQSVKERFGYQQFSKGDLLFYWNTDTVSNLVLTIIFVIALAEMGITIYKTFRYGKGFK